MGSQGRTCPLQILMSRAINSSALISAGLGLSVVKFDTSAYIMAASGSFGGAIGFNSRSSRTATRSICTAQNDAPAIISIPFNSVQSSHGPS